MEFVGPLYTFHLYGMGVAGIVFFMCEIFCLNQLRTLEARFLNLKVGARFFKGNFRRGRFKFGFRRFCSDFESFRESCCGECTIN
jgi:hypothetical protein